MPALASKLDPAGEPFRQNRASLLEKIARLRSLEARTRNASAQAKPLFDKRGQLLPRERIARLLDPGAPWLELSSMAGYCLDDPDPEKTVPGGGMVAGIGYVSSVRAMVVASDSGIDAGAIQHMGREKLLRAQELALGNKLPFVHLVESAGANLLKYRVEGFIHGGAIFYNLAKLSAAGLPVITVVHGSSTAGGAYMPGLSDYVIMVRGRAKAFLAGPPLLKAATGEIATDEELGGAVMHTHVSGLGEYLAENDADGIRYAREVLAHLDWRSAFTPGGKPPRYDAEELLGIIPEDYRKPV
ncbi:MAG: acyl-CoA carboxylase subunit beta, partial [Betaproteobacteria bacterium]|nr:acyl-CoA carboxylase subunit beta [Betaproteobacteria bacterium]